VISEIELRTRYPEIPWDQPVEICLQHTLNPSFGVSTVGNVVVVDGNAVYRTGETIHWVCRYCIAMHGLKAADIVAGRAPDFVFQTKDECFDHIETAHD